MFKLLYNCSHFTCQQSNAQNPSSQASAIHEPRTSRCTSCFQKRQRNWRSNCQHPLNHQKSPRVAEKISTSVLLTMPKPLTVWITTECGKFLEMGISDHLTCVLINLYQLELDMEQNTSSKLGKEYIKAVYCPLLVQLICRLCQAE